MNYPNPLLRGRFVRRYKRFFADIELDSGELITAHTPNTGTLRSCLEEGAVAWVSRNDNPARKLRYTWELTTSQGALTGVNTALANGLAAEAVHAGRIPELAGYPSLRREVPYGLHSRVDLLLEGADKPPCYVEVKNVSLGRDGVAAFPDAVSLRAAKHMAALAEQVSLGNRAAVLFVVQRTDCPVFEPADDIDPVYGQALRSAAQAGVMVLAWRAEISPQAVTLTAPLPVRFP
ncbi:MAG: DNA/RNA nuclease SfsA [Deltaproteobacteria bacterium]|nr:DNA/RNA nuclease SfsA [Deltaproteobacteria bacterium]